MKKIRQAENVRGVLIFKPEKLNLKTFSPDQSCPNRNYGNLLFHYIYQLFMFEDSNVVREIDQFIKDFKF